MIKSWIDDTLASIEHVDTIQKPTKNMNYDSVEKFVSIPVNIRELKVQLQEFKHK